MFYTNVLIYTDSGRNSDAIIPTIVGCVIVLLCVLLISITIVTFLKKKQSRKVTKLDIADHLKLQSDTPLTEHNTDFSDGWIHITEESPPRPHHPNIPDFNDGRISITEKSPPRPHHQNIPDSRINVIEYNLLPPPPYQHNCDQEQNIAVCDQEKSIVAVMEYLNDNDDDLEEACSVGFISSMQLCDDSSVSPNENFETSPPQFSFQHKWQVLEKDCFNPHCPCHNSHIEMLEHEIEREKMCINPDCQCQDLHMQKVMPPIENPSLFSDVEDHPNIPEGSDCIPPWMTKVCVLQCTEMGVEYIDKNVGFTIKVPRAAVPKGLSLTIEVAVSLYGPVEYPNGVQRVSPIIWVCVREIENFKFLKPVEISIQHCLKLDDTEKNESLGLQFLKAGHTKNPSGNYVFLPSDGSIAPSSSADYLTLATDHFCLLCITSRVLPETFNRIQHCLSVFTPQPFIPEQNDTIYCYVSFFWNYCLETVDKRTANSHKLIQRQKFTFSDQLGKRSLQIQYAEPENWILSLHCIDEVSVTFFPACKSMSSLL